MTTRRNVLASILALATLDARVVAAQAKPRYRVGTLLGPSAQTELSFIQHFKRGMQDAGYVEGSNVEYIHRWADGVFERVPGLTNELVSQRVEVILVAGLSVARPAQRTAPAIPLVMAGGFDPVTEGLAKSLARPGGSFTGIVNLSDDLARKHLELIRELLPRSRRIGVLSVQSGPSQRVVTELRAAAKQVGFDIVAAVAGIPDDIAPAIARLGADNLHALIVLASPLFRSSLSMVVEHAARLRVPVVYPDSTYVNGGGLMSYGPSREDTFYRAATYVDKILKGAKPGDLPIEQPTKFELVVNMKTAKALGLTLPQPFLMRVDKVIE